MYFIIYLILIRVGHSANGHGVVFVIPPFACRSQLEGIGKINPVIIDIHHCGAVAGNGGRAGIQLFVFCNRFVVFFRLWDILGDYTPQRVISDLRARNRSVYAGSLYRIIIVVLCLIVGILQPEDHGIVHHLADPLCLQGQICHNGGTEIIWLIIQGGPTFELIAGLGGAGRLDSLSTLGYILGVHMGTAVRIEHNPIARSAHGIEGGIFRNGSSKIKRFSTRLQRPIQEHSSGVRQESNTIAVYGSTGGNLLHRHDLTAILGQEGYINHVLKLSQIRDLLIFLHLRDSTIDWLLSLSCLPANKLLSLRSLRRSRLTKNVIFGQNLGTDHLIAIFKYVSNVVCILVIRQYRQGRHCTIAGHIVVGSPGIQRQHGEHHDKCQEYGEYPFC